MARFERVKDPWKELWKEIKVLVKEAGQTWNHAHSYTWDQRGLGHWEGRLIAFQEVITLMRKINGKD